jgi:putative DNA primase/helicase
MLLDALPGIDRERALGGVRFLARLGQDEDGPEFPSVTDGPGRQVVLGLAADEADLVILDNLSTLGSVDDENSAAGWDGLQATLLALKKRGVAVVVVHHARKDGQDFRGSSKLAATMDVVLGLERDAQRSVGEARFTLRWQKVRAGGRDLRESTVWLATGDDGRSEWRIEDGGRLGEMRRLLLGGRYTTQDALAGHFGVHDRTLRDDFVKGAALGLWSPGWPQKALGAVRAGNSIPLPQGAGDRRRGRRAGGDVDHDAVYDAVNGF